MDQTLKQVEERPVRITSGRVTLDGNLAIPPSPCGVVLFAHGSGSGRYSVRNRYVAERLREHGLATLLIDLLTLKEESLDAGNARYRFDIGLLAERLGIATVWLGEEPETRHLNLGYFGASTGAGAALVAAAQRPDLVWAIVSRGGRPDLAGPVLPHVRAPTLLIVGGDDEPVIEVNREAIARLRCAKRMDIISGATHLFEEPGALEKVAGLAGEWFLDHLAPEPAVG
ncbi:MAG: dienelactone hydrolase-like enzyme [Planctomycetota bacterium]|nr:dienelactone hydrolase-like enzyme [Planctomycetota bacterium]